MSSSPATRAHEDLAAERAVLGAIVIDHSLLPNVAEVIIPDDFANSAHREIFQSMLDLDRRNERVDPLTLAEELKTKGTLKQVGGTEYLQALDYGVPFGQNAVDYARIIKNQATRRSLARAGQAIFELASQETGNIDTLVDEAGRRIFEIAESKRTSDLKSVEELLGDTLDQLEKMKNSASAITGTPTGFVDLDNQLTGLHGGELIVLAARPGVGKTSLAMNIALNVAGDPHTPRAAAVFSLEMPSTQLLMRMLATHARVDMKKLRGGRLNRNDEDRIQDSANQLHQLKLFIDDSGALSSFDLRAKARRLKQKEPSLGLIIIDYLQLMHQKGRVESRQLEVSEISRGLKQLSKELDVPIIALSQLNRKVEERKDARPMLSDLRESGAIEQDADVVLFIHKEESEDDGGGGPDRRTTIPVQVIVAKQRNGPIGEVPLVFMAEYTRFESRSRDWQGS